MTQEQKTENHEKAAAFATRLIAAEKLIAFRSRIDEALPLIDGLDALKEVIEDLKKQMIRHQLGLLRDAFIAAEADRAADEPIH